MSNGQRIGHENAISQLTAQRNSLRGEVMVNVEYADMLAARLRAIKNLVDPIAPGDPVMVSRELIDEIRQLCAAGEWRRTEDWKETTGNTGE
jgi:hypothetical protein